MTTQQPQYNSWIRVRKLVIFAIIDLLLLLSLVWINILVIQLLLLLGLIIVSYILIIVGLAYYYFTVKGYQSKIHKLIVEQTPADSNLAIDNMLDIGAGSGSLAIQLKAQYPTTKVTAIDYWGDDWEYSKTLCENNARIMNADIEFIQASASKLPFDNQTFKLITSCLTFHEVKDSDNIYDVIAEAQRVLATDGYFVYLDLFLDQKIYPDLDTNLEAILGADYKLIKLDQLITLPLVLNHRKVLGNAAIIVGQK